MKKIIAVLLVISSLLMFSACRKTEISSGDETTNDVNETVVNEETKSETAHSDTTAEAETDAATDTETGDDVETDAVTKAPVETEAQTDSETDETVASVKNEMDAVKVARQYLGEVDPDTGYKYSYQFVEITTEGNYKIKVSWYLEEDERFSTCGYLLVSPDGKVTKFDW